MKSNHIITSHFSVYVKDIRTLSIYIRKVRGGGQIDLEKYFSGFQMNCTALDKKYPANRLANHFKSPQGRSSKSQTCLEILQRQNLGLGACSNKQHVTPWVSTCTACLYNLGGFGTHKHFFYAAMLLIICPSFSSRNFLL